MLEIVKAILTEETKQSDMLKLQGMYLFTTMIWFLSWVVLQADEMFGGYAWLCCIAIHVICTGFWLNIVKDSPRYEDPWCMNYSLLCLIGWLVSCYGVYDVYRQAEYYKGSPLHRLVLIFAASQ